METQKIESQDLKGQSEDQSKMNGQKSEDLSNSSQPIEDPLPKQVQNSDTVHYLPHGTSLTACGQFVFRHSTSDMSLCTCLVCKEVLLNETITKKKLEQNGIEAAAETMGKAVELLADIASAMTRLADAMEFQGKLLEARNKIVEGLMVDKI